MLCFPAVLFSGAILPVNLMAGAGAALSVVIPSRWAFEAIGHDLGARRILAEGGSPLGPPLLASYGDAGTQSTGTYWLILAAFAVVFLVATWACARAQHPDIVALTCSGRVVGPGGAAEGRSVVAARPARWPRPR